jgi:hypothetical protein
MNSDSPDKPKYPESDPDLASIRSAWERMEQAEPPGLIDQAVLNTARRQLEDSQPRHSMRWLGAFASAVVVILALAIVVRQDQQGPIPPVSETDGFRMDRDTSTATKTKREPELMLQDEVREAQPEMRQINPAARAAASEAAPMQGEELRLRSREALEENAARPDPEAWVERMLLLHAAGRLEELEAELVEFRRSWPDYPLPPELLD